MLFDGQNQNPFFLSCFSLRPPFAFTHQCCGITPDCKLSEPLGPLIYPSDPLQHCLDGCLHLAEPKSSFLLTSLFKFLSHWAAGFSSRTKHRPHEQTLIPICVQQLWQKQLLLLLKFRSPQFSPRPHNTFVHSNSHCTLKKIFSHFVQALGLFIYRSSCYLWSLSLFGVNLHLFSCKWQVWGQAVKMQREKGAKRGA